MPTLVREVVTAPPRPAGLQTPAVSGTEINDELCASIPGPNFMECGGPGGGAGDWRGPVARVTIQRVQ